jgi:hypothetical protein
MPRSKNKKKIQGVKVKVTFCMISGFRCEVDEICALLG